MALTFFFFIACFVTCLPFLYLCTRALRTSWDNKNDQVYEALRSPSVRNARNAFERRVALAIREAKQGYRGCAGCGFTNSMRANACVLCGAAFPVQKKRRLGFFPVEQADQKDVEADVGSSIEIVVATESTRQRRIRARKEWVRQVGEDGRVTWLHQPRRRVGFISSERQRYYVVQTLGESELVDVDPPTSETTPLESVEVESTPAPDAVASVTEPASNDQDESVEEGSEAEEASSLSIDDVVSELEDELKMVSTTVVDAHDADPTMIAYATAASRAPVQPQRVVNSINSAQRDFPTKLAHFITSTASMFDQTSQATMDGRVTTSRLDINRESLMVESLEALASLTPAQARAAIRVEFSGERGVDAGGVYREWFLLLNEQIVKPESGIFTCVDPQEQTFYLNPHSQEVLGEHHLAHFLAAGRILGRALLEGYVTGFHLALPLLKIILGLPVGFSDLEYFDPETFKNLQWLLENDGVDALCLDFTAVEKLPNGSIRVIDLVPGGSAIDVTDANKHEFVDRKLKYLLFERVADQLFAFLKGLYQVVPAELLMVFDAEELDYVLAGSDEIDVDDWEANTIISKNLMLQPAFFHFWKVVRELSTEERRRLLQFATGSTRVPPGGFSALTSQDGRLSLFSLNGVQPRVTWGCIHSHSCFNRLDVPLHRNVDAMREAVRAVVSSAVVGFTTA